MVGYIRIVLRVMGWENVDRLHLAQDRNWWHAVGKFLD